MSLKILSIFTILTYIFFIFTGCTTTITKYKTEVRPVEVTKYRTERKPVQKLVGVPYQAEVQVPNYIKSPKSKINRSDKRMRIVFLPIRSFQGNDTHESKILNKIKARIRSNGEFLNKYLIVNESKIKQILGINNLFNLSRKDIEIIGDKLNIHAVIAGQIKNIGKNSFLIKLEAIGTKKSKLLFSYNYRGTINLILKRIEEHFYGKTVQSGFKTKFVTKYKKEFKTKHEYVKVPYKVIEKKEISVPYQKKVTNKKFISYFSGIVFTGFILISFLIPKKK